jgi:hypothetical protein
MPWAFDQSRQHDLNERLRKALALKPTTLSEVTEQQKILLSAYPALSAWLQNQKVKADTPLQELSFQTDLPQHTDAATKFYSLVITNECKRLYHVFIETTKNKKNSVDLIYHTNVLLKKVKILLLHINKEMQNREVDDAASIQSNLTAFVLHYLKKELVAFYFSIQEVHKPVLEEVTDIENFFLLELQETIDKIIPLKQVHIIERPSEPTSVPGEVFTFGFTGDPKKLKTVISELCREIELLDTDHSRVDDLMSVFTSKNLQPGSKHIRIGCQTKQFRYILDKLDNYFNYLTLANIEKSQCFYSKLNRMMKENNLSASASKGRIKPDKQATIDNIFKHLQ